jgi:hypothetical protein
MATVYVERANKVRRVEESEVQRYLDLGYNVTDGKGNILKECVPSDTATLRAAYIKHKEVIAELENKVAELEAMLAVNAKKTPSKKKTATAE